MADCNRQSSTEGRSRSVTSGDGAAAENNRTSRSRTHDNEDAASTGSALPAPALSFGRLKTKKSMDRFYGTVEGQLSLHPEFTREEALAAAHREYNRQNAVRVRQRKKNQLVGLRERAAALEERTRVLEAANRRLTQAIDDLNRQNVLLLQTRGGQVVQQPVPWASQPLAPDVIMMRPSPSAASSSSEQQLLAAITQPPPTVPRVVKDPQQLARTLLEALITLAGASRNVAPNHSRTAAGLAVQGQPLPAQGPGQCEPHAPGALSRSTTVISVGEVAPANVTVAAGDDSKSNNDPTRASTSEPESSSRGISSDSTLPLSQSQSQPLQGQTLSQHSSLESAIQSMTHQDLSDALRSALTEEEMKTLLWTLLSQRYP